MFFVAVYLVVGVILAPVVALAVLVHPRLRRHARERLGFPRTLLEPGALWFHAASLGERRIVEAVLPGLQLREPALDMLITCTSADARARTGGADQVLCLPVDVLPLVLGFIDRVRPRALVLVEAELWPALLMACRLRGIPVVRLAPREGQGMRNLRRVPGLEAALLAGVAQLVPTHDLKALAPVPPAAFSWRGDALVGGSTREGDEVALLEAWGGLDPQPLLILAPRDPSRFPAVGALLTARGLRWSRRSAIADSVSAGTQVLLLDTLGELAGLYAGARAAFAGGTFDAGVGGHSPAEAIAAGCPVVRGPQISANAAAWAGVGADVADTREGLGDAICRAMARPRTGPPGNAAVAPVLDGLSPLVAAPPSAERSLRPWLWPLAWVWLAVVSVWPLGRKPGPIPVISVGGLTAGGSGKTPVAAWIAARLSGSVVVSRGYGRRSGSDVRQTGGVRELGDEAEMLARRGQPVASAPDRHAAVVQAARSGAKVAVLDDGFTARGLERQLEVVVLDGRWPDGGGPIPVGTRRVPRGWLNRADVVWSNHGAVPAWARAAARSDALFVEAELVPVAWLHRGVRRPLDALPARHCVAMAGIARPEAFFRTLRALGVDVRQRHIFPDHHAFGWPDLQAIEAWKDDHNVLVTEKDAARLPEGLSVWALVVEVHIKVGKRALADRLAPFGYKEGP